MASRRNFVPVNVPYHIQSIGEFLALLGLPKPRHPLFCVFNHADITDYSDEKLRLKTYGFYTISCKKGYAGKMRYGQDYYDFDEGSLVFHGPNQVIASELTEGVRLQGWTILFHPDFMHAGKYGFFSYSMNEGLHLSDEELQTLEGIVAIMLREYHSGIDRFSQDIIVSQLDLFLKYCERFYHRQFLTRRKTNDHLVVRVEALLRDVRGTIPTVQYLAEALHLSPAYLSDMLRTLTGRSAQQHINDYLIDYGKELLTTTSLTVSEIAYKLGYENPQAFHKLFKNKTQTTPLRFRASFN